MTAQRRILLCWDSKQSTGLYHEETRMDDVKKKQKEAGEKAQESASLVALAEDHVQFPKPTWWLTSIHNSNSTASNALF